MSRAMVSALLGRAILIAAFAARLSSPNSASAEEIRGREPETEPGWLPDISGSLWYTYVAPDEASADDASEIDRLVLQFKDGFRDDAFGLELELQHRPGRLGSYPRETWLDSAYGYVNTAGGRLKFGSVYTPFGPFWDHTYYGSIVYYKGYRHDADYGVTFENARTLAGGARLTSSVGYFPAEDGLNGATIVGQGHEHASDAEERNTFAFQLRPEWDVGVESKLALGLSGLAGEVDAAAPAADRQHAVEVHAVYERGPLTLTAEYVRYDQAGGADPALRGHVLGAEAYWEIYESDTGRFAKKVALNYSFSLDDPDSGDGLGRLHLPSVSVKFSEKLRMDVMRVDWEAGGATMDKSWRMMLYLYF
jgi:hypothetical protein